MNTLDNETKQTMIEEILEQIEYGTLALCKDNKPYMVPLNFVQYDNNIYIHGSKKGTKIEYAKENPYVSFCVVDSYSFLPSYFSTDDRKACPATQLFRSVVIEGEIKIVKDYKEKEISLEFLMKKLQKEGNYIPLENKSIYEKIIKATEVLKIIPKNTSIKAKFGQNYNKKRLQKVMQHLKQRGTKKDLLTLEIMEKFK